MHTGICVSGSVYWGRFPSVSTGICVCQAVSTGVGVGYFYWGRCLSVSTWVGVSLCLRGYKFLSPGESANVYMTIKFLH